MSFFRRFLSCALVLCMIFSISLLNTKSVFAAQTSQSVTYPIHEPLAWFSYAFSSSADNHSTIRYSQCLWFDVPAYLNGTIAINVTKEDGVGPSFRMTFNFKAGASEHRTGRPVEILGYFINGNGSIRTFTVTLTELSANDGYFIFQGVYNYTSFATATYASWDIYGFNFGTSREDVNFTTNMLSDNVLETFFTGQVDWQILLAQQLLMNGHLGNLEESFAYFNETFERYSASMQAIFNNSTSAFHKLLSGYFTALGDKVVSLQNVVSTGISRLSDGLTSIVNAVTTWGQNIVDKLDEVFNGQSYSPVEPDNSGVVDDYNNLESDIMGSVSGGQDVVVDVIDRVNGSLAGYAASFAVVSVMVTDLINIPPIGSIVYVSFAIGIFASILGIGLSAVSKITGSRQKSGNQKSGNRKRGK